MKASNIRPITDLKSHTKQLVQEVASGGKALVITQNGKPKTVLMGVRAYDSLQETVAMLKILARSQESLSGGRAYSTSQVRAAARAALERARRNA